MAEDTFAITPREKAIKLDASRKGRLIFSVSNTLQRQLKARASAEPEEKAKREWLKVQPEIQTLPPGGAEVFTVEIQVPPEAPAGSYRMHLVVVDDDKPDDFASVGPSASFEVPPAVAPQPPQWRKWLLIALGALVVLGGGGYLLCRLFGACGGSKGQGLHQSCKADDPKQSCAQGLKCAPLPSEFLECRLAPDSKCSNDSDCTSFWCKNGKCSRDDGVCANDADCRAEFTCKANICLKRDNQPCDAPEVCAGGFCTARNMPSGSGKSG